jgi:hypothetical protein
MKSSTPQPRAPAPPPRQGDVSVGGVLVANIVSGAITAPIFAIAVTVIYFELAGGFAAPAEPLPPNPIHE